MKTLSVIICVLFFSFPAQLLASSHHHKTYNLGGKHLGLTITTSPFFLGKDVSGHTVPGATFINNWHRKNHHNNNYALETYDIIVNIQKRLRHLGYYHNHIDGTIGYRTREAIRRFQSHNHMFIDGKISHELLRRLNVHPSWKSQSYYESETTTLKKKLRRLLNRAERRGAADPWVLQRLRKLSH